MSCHRPPPPADDLLLAYLDGVADEALASHLAECPPCHARLRALRLAERALRGGGGDPSCPPRSALAAYAEAELPPDQTGRIGAHLEGCPVCRADLAELAGFTVQALAIAADLDRARAALRPRVGGEGRARAPDSKPLGGSLASPLAGLRRVLAAFQPLPPLAAGARERGGAADASRSFSAVAGEVIVTGTLRPQPEREGFRLSGRVHGLRPAWVSLRGAGGHSLARAELDQHGAFSLTDLPPGDAWLRFEGPGMVLELDGPVRIPGADAGQAERGDP